MDNQNNRYVAYFDILGFKTATFRDAEKACQMLLELRHWMDDVLKRRINRRSKNSDSFQEEIIIADRIKIYIFSDSVLMFTKTDKEEDFLSILLMAHHLFANSICSGLPLRGGISFGEFFFDTDLHLFCGIPLVKAVELEKMSQWCGIVLDDIVAHNYQAFCNKYGGASILVDDDTPFITKWDVPITSSGKKNCWVINWPVLLKPRETPPLPLPMSVYDYYKHLEEIFGPYDELREKDQLKYKNTVDFLNAQRMSRKGNCSI